MTVAFELVDHPPYSPDLATSDYSLFPNIKMKTRGKQYRNDDEVISAVEVQDESFYATGIKVLRHLWKNCMEAFTQLLRMHGIQLILISETSRINLFLQLKSPV